MRLPDVKVNEAYAYSPERSSHSCSRNVRAVIVLGKEKKEVVHVDGCGRNITKTKTMLKVALHPQLNPEDMEAEAVVDIPRDKFNITYVEAKYLIWPWAEEVARVRRLQEQAALRKKIYNFKHAAYEIYLATLYARGFVPVGFIPEMIRARNVRSDFPCTATPNLHSYEETIAGMSEEKAAEFYVGMLEEHTRKCAGKTDVGIQSSFEDFDSNIELPLVTKMYADLKMYHLYQFSYLTWNSYPHKSSGLYSKADYIPMSYEAFHNKVVELAAKGDLDNYSTEYGFNGYMFTLTMREKGILKKVV